MFDMKAVAAETLPVNDLCVCVCVCMSVINVVKDCYKILFI